MFYSLGQTKCRKVCTSAQHLVDILVVIYFCDYYCPPYDYYY